MEMNCIQFEVCKIFFPPCPCEFFPRTHTPTSLPPTNTHPLISQIYTPQPDFVVPFLLPGALRDLWDSPSPVPQRLPLLLPTCRNCAQSLDEASGWGGQNLSRWVGQSHRLTHLAMRQAGGA